MSRRNIDPPVSEEVKGKHKETMKGMFDTKSKNTQNHHEQMMMALEDNKQKYDRNLYSDWLLKVYSRCTSLCIKEDKDVALSVWENKESSDEMSKLRQIEIQCGKNCMRKFDKGYKLFDNIEKTIFEQYMKDSDVDPNEMMQVLSQREEQRQTMDMSAGADLLQSANI
ncbi:UNKNOWN [Stylonychia lemnae]|uniref:Tim10-like domain-containing protein n=1 Tax=Stylonychia lemnae TaxID=5949 RepID=A0A078A1F1_STYLE|nr:UNKNOWN [Stylonychia lemnae]|eukprot:CDW76081.1 UNKNOWN [Stylonychia lemnae]